MHSACVLFIPESLDKDETKENSRRLVQEYGSAFEWNQKNFERLIAFFKIVLISTIFRLLIRFLSLIRIAKT